MSSRALGATAFSLLVHTLGIRNNQSCPFAVQRSSDTIGESERKPLKLHSLRLGTEEFGKEPAFVIPDGSHGGHPFDGLISPAGLGMRRVAIDLGRGEVAFSR